VGKGGPEVRLTHNACSAVPMRVGPEPRGHGGTCIVPFRRLCPPYTAGSRGRPSARRSEFLCRLSGRLESRGSILRRHSDSRLEVRQAAASSSSQYRSGRGLLIGELADGEPIMVAEGQVPPDEPTSYALKSLATACSRFSGLARCP